MPRFRIIRRPNPEDPTVSQFEVEELASYMSPDGKCIATYWGFAAGPFVVLDYAEQYAEAAIALSDRFVAKEYD